MVFSRQNKHKISSQRRAVASPIDNKSVLLAYKRWAHFYDVSFGFIVRSARQKLVSLINQECTGTLLEVGIGTGVSLPLYKKDLSITAIDYSQDMLKKATQRVREKNLTHVLNLECMDASDMSFPSDSFDNVVCMHVMSVVPDPVKVFEEVKRVCKKGGRIFIMNHFMCEEKGARFYIEKFMAPASRFLGWHPDFSKEVILNAAHSVHLEKMFDVGCFKLFTVLCFVKE